MARGGAHPKHCKAQLSTDMKAARASRNPRGAAAQAMRGYQACRREAGAIGQAPPKRRAR